MHSLSWICVLIVTIYISTVDAVCPSDYCQNGGSCDDSTGSKQCLCSHGYEGDQCQHVIVLCDNDPCDRGRCFWSPGLFYCYCDQGFMGDTCAEVDPCTSDPCKNDGNCAINDNQDGYICNCAENFSGTKCEIESEESDGGGLDDDLLTVILAVLGAFLVVCLIGLVVMCCLFFRRRRSAQKDSKEDVQPPRLETGTGRHDNQRPMQMTQTREPVRRSEHAYEELQPSVGCGNTAGIYGYEQPVQ